MLCVTTLNFEFVAIAAIYLPIDNYTERTVQYWYTERTVQNTQGKIND
ncbi:hypothetical protein [Pseudanabaena sp. Chao 1811]|nr:hypothetical protein [Pseudanabaena sp. Chao 1811]